MTTDFTRYTDKARQVHELSLREALQLGHNYIGPEHILLALVRNDSLAVAALARLGAEPKQVRKAVIDELVNDPVVRRIEQLQKQIDELRATLGGAK